MDVDKHKRESVEEVVMTKLFVEKRVKRYRIYGRQHSGESFYDSTHSGVDMQAAIESWKRDPYTKEFRIINIEEYK